jgi:hypothetical protein
LKDGPGIFTTKRHGI